MNAYEFTLQLADRVIWPLTIIIVVLLLRSGLSKLVPLLHKVKYKDFEADFAQQIHALQKELQTNIPDTTSRTSEEDKLFELVKISPNIAILEAWGKLADSAKAIIMNKGYKLDYQGPTPYLLIERFLERSQLLEAQSIRQFANLRRLRNEIAHAGEIEISPEHAEEYLKLCLQVKKQIKQDV